MKIHLYTVAWNEEHLMPFFLKHYSKFCDKIVVYDNCSTDSTVEIVKGFDRTEIRTYDSNNQIDDYRLLDLKKNCYKESRGQADWVIIADVDEFLYHPDILTVLKNYQTQGINFPKISGYEMIPDAEPVLDDDLPAQYKLGVPDHHYNKYAVFHPSLDVYYSLGCHHAAIPVNGVTSSSSDIKLLHYKMLNFEYYRHRHRKYYARLSKTNLDQQLGMHYGWSDQQLIATYQSFLSKRKQII